MIRFRKLIFFSTFLCLISAGSALLAQEEKKFVKSPAQPIVICEPEILDFGEVLSGETLIKHVKIRNTGEGDLVILKIDFTCGCTIPQVLMPSGEIVIPDKEGATMIGTLKSGEAAALDLELKTLSLTTGNARRQMTIYTNDPKMRTCAIPITAVVKSAFTYEPRSFDFRGVKKGTPTKRSILVRSSRAGAFKITDAVGLPPYLAFSVEEVKGDDLPCVKLTLELKKNAPVDSRNLKVAFAVESEKIKALEVLAYLDVVPPVVFKSNTAGKASEVDFGILPDGKSAVREIEIINDNPEVPYHIKEMVLTSQHADFFETQLTVVEAGNHYKVKVMVKPGIDVRFFKGTITFQSDHPDLPKKDITFKGWFLKDKD